MDELLEERRGAVALLTLHRPERLNAVSAGLYTRLCEAMARAEQDRSVRAVVLTGAGRAFCVGADLVAHREDRPGDARRAYVELGQRAARALLTSPLPVVAAVNGHAVGAGLELALACDLIVAGQKARFGLPEITLGLIPGFGGTQRLIARTGLARARELVYLGSMIPADEALRIGLVNRVVPDAELAAEAAKLAGELAARAPVALRQAKRATRAAVEPTLAPGLRYEVEAFGVTFATDDRVEGLTAFLEKRPPAWKGR